MDPDKEISRLRRGDTLELKALQDLAQPEGTLRVLFQRLEAIEKRGAFVAELATGRRTPRDTVAMIRDASQHLRKGLSTRQARANARKRPGRKPKERMDKKDAKAIWRDRVEYATNEAALEAMTGWTAPEAYRHLGKSGREPGRRKRV